MKKWIIKVKGYLLRYLLMLLYIEILSWINKWKYGKSNFYFFYEIKVCLFICFRILSWGSRGSRSNGVVYGSSCFGDGG